jgi:DNA-binding IclR family transcriptional regulator
MANIDARNVHNMHMSTSPTSPRQFQHRIKGAQSVERAVALLSLVAAQHADGVTLSQLVAMTGLDRTTAWRILTSLEQQELAAKDPETGLYRLGMATMAWGLSGMSRPPLVEACRPIMKTIARVSGDNVFLVTRSGDYSHCLHLEEGSHQVQDFPLNVGGTRLLGLGVASIALLAMLDDEKLAQHYQRHRSTYLAHDVTALKLQRWAARARQAGYSHISAGGVAGVGLRFAFGACGDAAFSVIAPKARLPKPRGSELIELMQAEVKKMRADWPA